MIERKVILIFLCCFFMTACDKKKEPEVPSPRVIKIFTLEPEMAQKIRVFPARIQAGDNTELAFKRAGQLIQLNVRDGMPVKAGQLIATLNDADAKLRVRDRQTALQLAERQFQRFHTLARQGAVSQSEMDVQSANRDAAATALKIAQEELQFLALRAPFDGVIARVQARNHHVVAAGQPIALLTRTDLLDVMFTLPESLFTSLDSRNIDYQPEVQFNALPGRYFRAQYKEHTSQTDANTLTYQVILTMPRPADLPAIAGLSGSVRVKLHNLPNAPAQPHLVVPAAAVFNPDRSPTNQPHVWLVVQDGETLRIKDRPVKVGQLSAQGVEIISGLQPGDRIAAAGVGELREGEAVRIWQRERGL